MSRIQLGDAGCFQVAVGSVTGRDHTRRGRNNQDAVAVAADPATGALVAIVADGCGGSPHSEVGARLGARWLATHALARAAEPEAALLPGLAQGLCAFLAEIVGALDGGHEARRAGVVADLLLFTVLGAVLTPERTLIFGLGDGLWAANQHGEALGPELAPSYLAYRLVRCSLLEQDPGQLDFKVHFRLPTPTLQALWLATDGALALRPGEAGSPLAGFVQEPRFLHNPGLVQKQLQALVSRPGGPQDDTTLALIRRCPDEEAPCAC